MTKLSVNINKVATLRNARGGNVPNVVQVAIDAELYGAQGITIHPRPDERHITAEDVYNLKDAVTTEYNIEGYPDDRFMKFLSDVKPEQATLVPDPPDVLTSNAGWDVKENSEFLKDTIKRIKNWGIRVSLFMETDEDQIKRVPETGADRIELYTESYADQYRENREKAIEPFVNAAECALKEGLELNAGHDLDRINLRYFKKNIPELKEVSIGHALISDALYFGLENTIQMYLRELR